MRIRGGRRRILAAGYASAYIDQSPYERQELIVAGEAVHGFRHVRWFHADARPDTAHALLDTGAAYLTVVDTKTGERVHTLDGSPDQPKQGLRVFQLGPQGTHAYIASDGQLARWPALGSDPLWTVSLSSDPDTGHIEYSELALAIAETDALVAVSLTRGEGDNQIHEIRLIDASTGELLLAQIVPRPIRGLAFDPAHDKTLWAGTSQGELVRYRFEAVFIGQPATILRATSEVDNPE